MGLLSENEMKLKSEGWQIDNYNQMKVYRVLLAIIVLFMVGLVGYNLLFENAIVKTWSMWVPMVFILLQTSIFKPQFITINFDGELLKIVRRGILEAKKNQHVSIPVSQLKNSYLQKNNSLFRGHLIIEYKNKNSLHQTKIPLNNFTLIKRESLVKKIDALT